MINANNCRNAFVNKTSTSMTPFAKSFTFAKRDKSTFASQTAGCEGGDRMPSENRSVRLMWCPL